MKTEVNHKILFLGVLFDSSNPPSLVTSVFRKRTYTGLLTNYFSFAPFATKFIAVFLVIKVKGSRPMTYQCWTVDVFATAKEKGGFIDQKTFKTAGKYGFAFLILTNPNMQLLNGYILYAKPLLKPQCDFVLVNRNGGQHGKLGEIMSKLVFDAIGKYIHPTRYRQIVETESLNQLTSEEQRILSEDQNYSSGVAKIHYQKRRSREVAVKAQVCLQKLQGSKGSEVDEDVQARFGGSTCSPALLLQTACLEKASLSSPRKVVIPTGNPRTQRKHHRAMKFTSDEDDFLKQGITTE